MQFKLNAINEFTATVPLITDTKEIKHGFLKIDTGAGTSMIGQGLLGMHTPMYSAGILSIADGTVISSKKVREYTLLFPEINLLNLTLNVCSAWTINSSWADKILLGMDILRNCDLIYNSETEVLDVSPNSDKMLVYVSPTGTAIKDILSMSVEELMYKQGYTQGPFV